MIIIVHDENDPKEEASVSYYALRSAAGSGSALVAQTVTLLVYLALIGTLCAFFRPATGFPISLRFTGAKYALAAIGVFVAMVASIVLVNADGSPYTVRYQFLSRMLLNEVQKQYRRSQQQEIAQLKERLSRIEKMLSGAPSSGEGRASNSQRN